MVRADGPLLPAANRSSICAFSSPLRSRPVMVASAGRWAVADMPAMVRADGPLLPAANRSSICCFSSPLRSRPVLVASVGCWAIADMPAMVRADDELLPSRRRSSISRSSVSWRCRPRNVGAPMRAAATTLSALTDPPSLMPWCPNVDLVRFARWTRDSLSFSKPISRAYCSANAKINSSIASGISGGPSVEGGPNQLRWISSSPSRQKIEPRSVGSAVGDSSDRITDDPFSLPERCSLTHRCEAWIDLPR